ncbi:MAG: translocation/assembly module TamB domain-containing protein [Pseudomonadota bacterium]
MLKRFFLTGFVAVSGLLGLLILALVVLTQTGPGREALARIINTTASGPDLGVRIEGLNGLLSGALRVSSVTVSDGKGPWLALEGIALDWSPLALAGLSFSADRLHIDRIEVLRPPQPGESVDTPSDSGASTGLPVAIEIKSVSLKRLALGEPVAGTPMDLRAAGNLKVDPNPLDALVNLRIHRDDDVAGSALIALEAAPERGIFDLNLTVSEPRGGVLAGLLRIPDRPAVDISVVGQGPMDAWAADLGMTLDGNRIANGTATISKVDDRVAATLDLEAVVAPLLPEPLASVLKGQVLADISASTLDQEGFAVDQFRIRTDTLTADAGGRYDPNGGVVDLFGEAALSHDAGWVALPGASDPLAVRAPHVTFNAKGPVERVDWQVIAGMAGVRFPGGEAGTVRVEGDGAATDLRAQKIAFQSKLRVADLNLFEAPASRLLNGDVTGRIDGRLDESTLVIDNGTVTATALSVEASGSAGLATGTLAVDARATTAWPVDPKSLPGLAEDQLVVSAQVNRTADGTIAIPDLMLQSNTLAARLAARLIGNRITVEGDGQLADLSRLSADVTGAIPFEVSVDGPLDGPTVKASATGNGVAFKGQAIDGPNLTIDALASVGAPSGTLDLKAVISDTPLSVSARLATDQDGTKRLSDLNADLAGATLTGNLALPTDGVPVGSVIVSASELDRLGALLGTDLAGSVEAKAYLANTDGQLTVQAAASVPTLSAAGTQVRNADLATTITDALGAFGINGRLSVASILAGGVDAADVSVTAEHGAGLAPGATGFTASATAAGIPLESAGQILTSENQTTLRLEKFQARYQDLNPRLAAPTEIVAAGRNVEIGETVILLGGGRVTASGVAGDALAVDVGISALPLSIADAFAPGTGLTGTLSGDVTLSGAAADPAVDYELTWSGAGQSAARAAGIPPVNVSAAGAMKAQTLTFDVRTGGFPGLGIGISGQAALSGSQAVNAQVRGPVPFALLDGVLSPGQRRLTGTGQVDLAVAGSLQNPSVSGTFQANGASFVDGNVPIVIRDLALATRLSLEQVEIERLTGRLSTGGTVSAAGVIDIRPGTGMPADLSLAVRNGRYTDGNIVSTEFNADLGVKGPLQGAATVAGDIVLDRVDVTIPEKLPRSIATLNVEHRNAPAGVARQNETLAPKSRESTSGGGDSAIGLDIRITAARQIFVRGRGLDAELGGSLRLTGPASSPIAVGRFEMRRGRLNILTRRFDFSRGAIGFAGSMDPLLDFAADTTAGGTSITVGVEGPASDPEITLSSSPDLPDEEILSRLLFDESLGSLSPLQAARLASAVSTLGGIGGSYGVVDRVRDTLGLSDVDITSDADGNAKVTVGRQVGDKVYLGVEQGVDADSSRVRIDIDITKNLKARGEVGADGSSKGGLFFERNY